MSYVWQDPIRTAEQLETVRRNGGMVYIARQGKAVSVEFVRNWPHKKVMTALERDELFTCRKVGR